MALYTHSASHSTAILPIWRGRKSSQRQPRPNLVPSLTPFRILVLSVVVLSCLLKTVRSEDPVVQFSTPEEVPVGTVLGSLGDDTVLPLGLTPEVRGSLKYSQLPQGNGRSNLFSVDADTGQVTAKGRLDREALCGLEESCDLDIQVAVQSAVSQFFKKVKVIIRVDDVNDNTPTFPRDSTQIHVSESVPIGTSFAIEGATDLDIGEDGIQKYQMVPEAGSFLTNVTRSSDGRSVINLIVSKTLDRETTPQHSFLLLAVDGGNQPKTGSVEVRILVDDVNDNPPVFEPSTYNTSLPETSKTGTKVLQVVATDKDTAAFGIQEYRFKPQQRDDVTDYFSIDPQTGEITTTRSLLQRQGQTFRLVVECQDKGLPPLVARAEVEVSVEDTMNSAPQINLNVMFQGTVSEVAQSGTVVALLEVQDRDAGLNGIIGCSIISDAFELQPRSHNEFKVIVVRQLDREAEQSHDVSVICQDAGTPPLIGVANFTVTVKDENDKTPYFSQLTYRKTVQENNRVGQILLRVSAQDDDIGENARISFHLLEAPSSLRIDSRGNIIATEPLDYETNRRIRFKVIATDNGKSPRSNAAEVIIDVTDVNDETPQFERLSYVFTIAENNPANKSISSVKATDRDSGMNGKIRYSLLPRVSPFSISSSGLITAREKLDREYQPVYNLTVLAIDQGAPAKTGTATVTIQVTDENDYRPRIWFPKTGNTSIPVTFDMKPNSVVIQILAEDKDSGNNRKLEYHLASSSGRSLFKVGKSSGELILRRKLTLQDAGRHRLTVVVMDKSSASPLASNSTFDVVVFAPNRTADAARDRETEHVMVVIILGVITGIVTVAVVITIVVIRRADRQRRKYLHNRTKVPPGPEKFEENPMAMEVGYVVGNDPPGGGGPTTTSTSGGGGGLGGKPAFRGGSKGDDSSRDVTQDEGFADKSFNTSQGSSGPTDQTEWSKALRLHQDLLKLHGVDSAFLAQGGGNVDDVISDGSVESTTCDSGRGGSEEDNHSHGRASPSHRDAFMNNLNHPSASTTSASASRPTTKPSRHPISSNHNSSTTNIINPASSFNPNTTAKFANIPRAGLPAHLHLQGRQLGHSLDSNIPPPNPRRSTSVPTVKHVSFRDDFRHEWPEILPPHRRGQGQGQAQGRHPLHPAPSSNSPPWRPSRGDHSVHSPGHHQKGFAPLDLNIGESFETADDGNSTTTSGSYTVDDLSPRCINGPYLSPEQAVV